MLDNMILDDKKGLEMIWGFMVAKRGTKFKNIMILSLLKASYIL